MTAVKPTLLALLVMSGVISACTPGHTEPHQTAPQQPKVVQLTQAKPTQASHQYQFPATVAPVKTVKLNFEVSGRLNHVDMTQGSNIKQGHLLASVDSAPFERRMRENKARHRHAELELERIKSLYQRKMAAKRELDQAEVNAEIAKIELENSVQDLSYTQLVSPFDALISQRLIEKDSFISAGTAVVVLQDVSKIRFEINVSERVLSAELNNQLASATASIAGVDSQSFPVTYVEHSTQPDPITQTYKVFFEMEPIQGVRLHPGTRAYLNVSMKSAMPNTGVLIPMTALVPQADGSYKVWRLDEASKQVHLHPVDVAGIEQNLALITQGLSAADQVVSAGISQMRESLLVQPYTAE